MPDVPSELAQRKDARYKVEHSPLILHQRREVAPCLSQCLHGPLRDLRASPVLCAEEVHDEGIVGVLPAKDRISHGSHQLHHVGEIVRRDELSCERITYTKKVRRGRNEI